MLDILIQRRTCQEKVQRDNSFNKRDWKMLKANTLPLFADNLVSYDRMRPSCRNAHAQFLRGGFVLFSAHVATFPFSKQSVRDSLQKW